jgi:ribosomal protein S18 acetylase RimI-like enzyme
MAAKALSIVVSDEVRNSAVLAVGAALAAEMAARFGPRDEAPFSVLAYAGEVVVGGASGASHWGWCYIRQIWVDGAFRRAGVGRRLLAEIDGLARTRGCEGVYVDTFDAGAVRFYERAGFVVCGRIEGFPAGFARVFLQKRF